MHPTANVFLRFDLETDAIDGKLLLAECSRLFHETLRGDIERQLRQAAVVGQPEGEVSRLVLDLGDLSVTHWQTELAKRLTDTLATELARMSVSERGVTQADVPMHGTRSASRLPARGDNVSGRSMVAPRTLGVSRQGGVPRASAKKLQSVVPANASAASAATAAMPVIAAAASAASAGGAVWGSGLVLLWPFLARLWSEMGYTERGAFRDEWSRSRAVRCLDWLIVAGGPDAPASAGSVASAPPPISPLMCGLSTDLTVNRSLDNEGVSDGLSKAEHAHLTALRESLPARLPGLDRCSPRDITSLFLQRRGTVRTQNGVITVQVERDASDILLRSIPWPMQQLVFPWLESLVNIDWL